MAGQAAAFEWNEKSPACVATYKILEGDNFLDQFEDADLPFEDAGATTLGRLRYFPKTTTNPDIIELLALEIAKKFLKLVVKIYTVSKERPEESSAEILEAIAGAFADPDKTIADLAEVVDDHIKFPGEG